MIQRTERIPLNGFFVNIKLSGKYRMFPLVDISEDGVGVKVPKNVILKKGEEYEVRYNIADQDCDIINTYKDFFTHKSAVICAMGKVMRMQEKDEHYNIVGLEMDYSDIDEEIDIVKKMETLRTYIKKRMSHPEIQTQFKIRSHMPIRETDIPRDHVFEGMFSFDRHHLSFFVHADYEYLYLEGDQLEVEFPLKIDSDRFVCYDAAVISNEKYNMYRNLITLDLSINLTDTIRDQVRDAIADFLEHHDSTLEYI